MVHLRHIFLKISIHVEVATAVLLVRGVLLIYPFDQVAKRIERTPVHPRLAFGNDDDMTLRAIRRAVARAHRIAGPSSCLVQALAAMSVARRRNLQCDFRVGVAPVAGGGLVAHAWLEHNGQVLVGSTLMLPFLSRLPY